MIYSITDEYLGSSSILATVSDTAVNILGACLLRNMHGIPGTSSGMNTAKESFQSGLYPLTHPLLRLRCLWIPQALECLYCPPLLFWWDCSVNLDLSRPLILYGEVEG